MLNNCPFLPSKVLLSLLQFFYCETIITQNAAKMENVIESHLHKSVDMWWSVLYL